MERKMIPGERILEPVKSSVMAAGNQSMPAAEPVRKEPARNQKQAAETEYQHLLMTCNRPGMDILLREIRKMGFYEQPASTKYHLNVYGGLLTHSLNVYHTASDLNQALKANINESSIIITSLLHDLGKAGQYGKRGYVPNILSGGRQSETQPWTINKNLYPMDHELRSVFIINRYIELTEDEQWAIVMHNGMYGNQKWAIQGHETPLYLILHYADLWSSSVIERSI